MPQHVGMPTRFRWQDKIGCNTRQIRLQHVATAAPGCKLLQRKASWDGTTVKSAVVFRAASVDGDVVIRRKGERSAEWIQQRTFVHTTDVLGNEVACTYYAPAKEFQPKRFGISTRR